MCPPLHRPMAKRQTWLEQLNRYVLPLVVVGIGLYGTWDLIVQPLARIEQPLNVCTTNVIDVAVLNLTNRRAECKLRRVYRSSCQLAKRACYRSRSRIQNSNQWSTSGRLLRVSLPRESRSKISQRIPRRDR